MIEIKNIFEFQMGCYEPRFENGNDKVDLLKSSNFNNSDVKQINTVYDKNSKYVVVGSEILMRQAGNVEFYIHECSRNTYFDSTIIKLIPKTELNIYYLLYKLNGNRLKKQVEVSVSGSTVKKINVKEFEKMKLDLSDKENHEEIGSMYKLKIKRLSLLKRMVELEEVMIDYI